MIEAMLSPHLKNRHINLSTSTHSTPTHASSGVAQTFSARGALLESITQNVLRARSVLMTGDRRSLSLGKKCTLQSRAGVVVGQGQHVSTLAVHQNQWEESRNY